MQRMHISDPHNDIHHIPVGVLERDVQVVYQSHFADNTFHQKRWNKYDFQNLIMKDKDIG